MDFLTDIFSGPMGLSMFGLGSATSGAGSIFSDMSVPGLPTVTPPNGLGLLRAGDDDMRPPPMPGGTGALPLLKAGQEGPAGLGEPRSVGMSRSFDPTTTGSTTPPAAVAQSPGAASRSEGPALPTAPQIAAQPFPKPPAGAVPSDPGFRSPHAVPGSPIPASVTGTPAAGQPTVVAAPGSTATATEASPSSLQTIKDALSKMPNLQAAQQKQLNPGSMGGMQGDPAAASRQGASQLFQSIMDEHAKRAPPPRGVPALPASLLKRFPQMGA